MVLPRFSGTSPNDEHDPSGSRARLTTLIRQARDESATTGAHRQRDPVNDATQQQSALRQWAARWLPDSWSESRVDIGRAGLAGLACTCLVLLTIVLFGLWSSRPTAEPEPAPALPVMPVEAPPPRQEPQHVVVSVVGRVSRPGLVTVAPGARVADALHAAGGPLPDTDVTALNLARRLADGEQLYVAIPSPSGAAPANRTAGPAAGDDRIDLNTATEEQLDQLPGVGSTTAERIVRWREEHGRFASPDQLREVEGIGDTRMSKLRDRVRT